MVAIFTSLGVVIMGGAFVAFPWGAHSPGRVILAVVLWIVGFLMFVVAFALARREGAKAPIPDIEANQGASSGPMVIARELVNNGTIAHTVAQPTNPVPLSPSELKEAARCRLIDARAAGEKINRQPLIEKVVERASPWQDSTYDFLADALIDPMPAQMFGLMSAPIEGQPVHAGLGHRISQQVTYLGEMLSNFDMYQIKVDWQP